jgi:hypothetical protein
MTTPRPRHPGLLKKALSNTDIDPATGLPLPQRRATERELQYDVAHDPVLGGDTFTGQPRGLGALIPTTGGGNDADFGPYMVNLADEYYQGPASSTRVAGHQFIPLDTNWERRVGMGLDTANTLRGDIYVRFQRKTGDPGAAAGNLWRYGPCSLSDYRKFREVASKGRAVQALEAFGHGNADADAAKVGI